MAGANAASTKNQTRTPHFALLDGLRGIAAVAICYIHATLPLNLLPNGFLAVDFFFALSGFVVAYSYGARLADGAMSFGQFVKLRFIRLYPLLFFGTILGFAVFALRLYANNEGFLLLAGLASLIVGLFVLPSPFLARYHMPGEEFAWPLNPPTWSLFFEIVANVVYGAIARYANFRTLSVALVIFMIGYVLAVVRLHTLGFGNGWEGAAWGFCRVAYAFTAGLFVYHIRAHQCLTFMRSIPTMLLPLILILCFLSDGTVIGALEVIALFPVLVLAGSHARLGKSAERFCLWFGAISYPLYVIHWPLLKIVKRALSRFDMSPAETLVIMALATALMVFVAHIVLKLYDLPVRRALTRRFVAKAAIAY
jgi:peptidoglycan/LPS O-acetylase OafA/YrhL